MESPPISKGHRQEVFKARDRKAMVHKACALKILRLVKLSAQIQAKKPRMLKLGCREDATKIQLRDNMYA